MPISLAKLYICCLELSGLLFELLKKIDVIDGNPQLVRHGFDQANFLCSEPSGLAPIADYAPQAPSLALYWKNREEPIANFFGGLTVGPLLIAGIGLDVLEDHRLSGFCHCANHSLPSVECLRHQTIRGESKRSP